VTSDILAATLKGPYHLGASFIVSYRSRRCMPSNQTFLLHGMVYIVFLLPFELALVVVPLGRLLDGF
jgi:hypothetical protein